ncbi:3-oxoacyl-ACP synthase [Vicingaceae bacterium]|jgi:transcription elongation GreA/GreB family factor|nr:3-oxoacyl-ACP synthase [Vicingaceae bacterium]
MSNIKKQLHSKCSEITSKKVNELNAIIKDAQNAANNETKSSAGDKHETGRAMAQLETEKLTKQLSEALKLEQTLSQINPDTKHLKIGLGSLVTTNNGVFYISISLGKITLNDNTYFVISAASPIGKLLLTKKEKETFSFNGKNYIIQNIN